MEYIPQRTASVWMPFKQTCDEESGDADFDSFKTAPWDAGGTQRDKLHEVMCRAMVHNVDRSTTGNTKCELTTKVLVDTNCPRLKMTPGEGDVTYRSTDWSAERHTLSAGLSLCLSCIVCRVPWPHCRRTNCILQYNGMTPPYVLRYSSGHEWYSDRNERCVCPPAGITAETRFGGTS